MELALLAVVAAVGVKLVTIGQELYDKAAYPLRYTELIEAACEEKGLEPALVYAVVRTESNFSPDAQSSVGARGLMQLMPDAYNWVRMRRGEEQTDDFSALFDPATNIDYGTSMLRMLLDEFGSVNNALCAYHGGWGSVKSWLEDPEYAPDGQEVTNIPFADTKEYVEKVQKTLEIYRELY